MLSSVNVLLRQIPAELPPELPQIVAPLVLAEGLLAN
jgi:hypothetical protein